MGRGLGVYGGVARVGATGSYDTGLPGIDLPDEHLDALPLIEISDKDYRSFCWPCHALEETGDGQSRS